MSQLMMTNEQIKELISAFNTANLGEIAISQGDFSLKIKAKNQVKAVAPATVEVSHNEVAQSTPVVAQPVVVEEVAAPVMDGKVVKAPIIGTFYAAPAPDKDDFIKVGQTVKKGDVLFIIESMKLMNEIQSEVSGVVTDILVETGSAVEYDQPIVVIK